MKAFIVSLMLLLVVLTEILLVIDVTMGLILYIIFLASVCIILSKKEELNSFDKLLSILFVVPLVKILQIFITLSFPWKALIGYATLLTLSVYYVRWFKVKVSIKGNYSVLPLGVIVGALVGILGKIFLVAITEFSILLIFAMVLSEELFFRGLVQKSSKPVIGTFLSIIMPALFYGLLHISFGFFSFVYFLTFGLISGVIYESTDNIVLCFFLGLIANIILFMPF